MIKELIYRPLKIYTEQDLLIENKENKNNYHNYKNEYRSFNRILDKASMIITSTK